MKDENEIIDMNKLDIYMCYCFMSLFDQSLNGQKVNLLKIGLTFCGHNSHKAVFSLIINRKLSKKPARCRTFSAVIFNVCQTLCLLR